jgi:hypothetical protein
MMQPGFIIIDENRRRDVHRVAEHQTLLNPTFLQAFLHLGGDVDKRPAGGHLKPKFFAVAFHFFPPTS